MDYTAQELKKEEEAFFKKKAEEIRIREEKYLGPILDQILQIARKHVEEEKHALV